MRKGFKGVFQELGQSLRAELAYAVNDIRQKVVETGWFGQPTTPRVLASMKDLYGSDPVRGGGQTIDASAGIEAPTIKEPRIEAATVAEPNLDAPLTDGTLSVELPSITDPKIAGPEIGAPKETPLRSANEISGVDRMMVDHTAPEPTAGDNAPYSFAESAAALMEYYDSDAGREGKPPSYTPEDVAANKRAANLYVGDLQATRDALRDGMMQEAGVQDPGLGPDRGQEIER